MHGLIVGRPQLGEVLRALHQGERAEGERTRRRLVSPGQQPVGQPGELSITDVVAVLADQHAEQALARCGPLRDHQPLQVVQRRPDDVQRRIVAQVETSRTQRLEAVPVRVRHTQQLADHQ